MMLHAFWEVESLGIVNEKTQSPAETEALQNFKQTVTYKSDKPALLENFRVAKILFEGLKRRSKMNATLYSRYNDAITDYLQQGISEDVRGHLYRRTSRDCEILHATSCSSPRR